MDKIDDAQQLLADRRVQESAALQAVLRSHDALAAAQARAREVEQQVMALLEEAREANR